MTVKNVKPKDYANLIDIVDFDPDLLTDYSTCVRCNYKDSFLCDQNLTLGNEGIIEYFEIYGAKIEVWEFHDSLSKAQIREKLYRFVLDEHRKGKWWIFTFANFHCGESCEKQCQCDRHRCFNYDEVQNRKFVRCVEYWFDMPEEYRKQNIVFVVK